MRIPLARPFVREEELEGQARALRSGRLVLGQENARFEEAVAQAAGRPYGVALASGTAALHLALWALDLPADAEVIVPAFTFPAPAHAARVLGLATVPVDVDPETWNLAPEAVAAAITSRTRAILAVDQFGLPADHARLETLADRAGAVLVEDAACALGATGVDGRPAGAYGRVACFSFHPRKIATTGEGGCLVTADRVLAERVRRLRHHGQTRAGEFVEPGLNLRLGEPAAAVGRAQLARLPALVAERRLLAARYRSQLPRLPVQTPAPGHVFQTFAVVLPDGVDRARVITRLADQSIEAAPATYALHRLGSFPGLEAAAFPVADRLHHRALALPLWNGMTEAMIDEVAHRLLEDLA
jgi:perosamine synthetase